MYITNLYFFFQLIFCGSFFVFKFKRRKLFWLRIVLSFSASYALMVLTMYITSLFSTYVFLLYFLFTQVFFVLTIFFCFDVKIYGAIFAAIGGYAAQHIGFCIAVICAALFETDNAFFAFSLNIFPYIISGLTVNFIFVWRNRNKGYLFDNDKRSIFASLIILVVTILLSVFIGYFGPILFVISARSYSILCCLLVLAIQYGFFQQNKLSYEKTAMEHIFREKENQYDLYKDSVEQIRMKFHDIKHHLNALSLINDENERKDFINDIKHSVLIFDITAKTGNNSLDIILTEKALLCEKNDIKFSYLLNGTNFDFMEPLDIYSLFCNALDNAIESLVNEPNKEKRLINLNSGIKNDFLFLCIDNYCATPPVIKNGLPVTTKEDSFFHGYGVKSIRYIVEKYHGNINISYNEDKFIVDIIFPAPKHLL